MTDGPDIDLDQAGFEADGLAVPTVEPDIYFDDPPKAGGSGLDLEPFMDFLISGCKTPGQIGEKLLFLAFLMPRVPSRPASYAELGRWLNVSGTTAKAKLEAFKPIFIGQIRSLLEG